MYNRRQSNLGVGLIEIIITVLVLAIGLLGVSALLNSGLRASEGSLLRSQANTLAYEIHARLLSNTNDARCNRYNVALGAAAPAAPLQVNADITAWKTRLARQLPAGDGAIACAADAAAGPVAPCERSVAICTVTVQWDDGRAGGLNAQQFTVVARP